MVQVASGARTGCHDGDERPCDAQGAGPGLGQAVPGRHRGMPLFTLFAYLAWKLARWQVRSRACVAAVLALALAPLLRAREDRLALVPVLVVAVMIGASVFTPTALWFTHLADPDAVAYPDRGRGSAT